MCWQLSSVVKDLLEKSESDTVTMQVFQSISDKLRQLNEDVSLHKVPVCLCTKVM